MTERQMRCLVPGDRVRWAIGADREEGTVVDVTSNVQIRWDREGVARHRFSHAEYLELLPTPVEQVVR